MKTTSGLGSKKPRDAKEQFRLFIAMVATALLSLTTSAPIVAQCIQGPATCMNHATLPQRSCSASVMCGGFPATTTGFIMLSMSNNVANCTPTSAIFMTASTPSFFIMATAPTLAPATRSCNWFWYSASGTTSGNFSITQADGLPVELMEFSLE